MTRLPDLSLEQIRLLVKLDDGFDYIDRAAREICDLPIDSMRRRAGGYILRMSEMTEQF